MAERLCCSRGHRWEPAFPIDVWPPDFRSACPVCGAGPIGPTDVTETTARAMLIAAVICVLVGPALLFINKATLFVGVFLLVVAGVVMLCGVGIWVARQRAKEMASVAEAMNFTFMRNLTLAGLRALAPFHLFTLGGSHKAYNAMQGRVGDSDGLFVEYQYTTGSGKSSQTHQIAAVILPDGAPGAPDFSLAPKTFFDKLAGFFTHGAIDVEDAPEFTNRCKLSGRNAGAVREAFHPDLTSYLGRDGRWFIEAVDEQLLLYQQRRVRPGECPGLVTDALEIRDLLRGAGRRTE